MKILIAEDSVFAQQVLEAHLKKWGYEILFVDNGYDALSLLRKEDAPKLVLLDWIMPRVNGADVCKVVRKMKLDVPPYIIMITRKPQVNDIVEGLNAGADDYVTKPFVAIELKARIDAGIRIINSEIKLYDKVVELEKTISKINSMKIENLKAES